MKYELTRDRLTGLLIEAEKAHSGYEKGLGRHDENWPKWYAGYIMDRLEREAAST
jgi:hypothetical protein